MKLIIFAFILSLTIHFLLFSPFSKEQEKSKHNPSTSKTVNKTAVRYVKILPKLAPKHVIKEKIVKPKKIKKVAIKKTFKKVEKKKIIPQKKKRVIKKPKKIIPKISKKIALSPTPTKKLAKKVEIKPQEKRKTIPKKSLENFFLAEPVPLDKNMLDSITKQYLKVYGEEYNSFTKVQKVFLQNNLKTFKKITQKTLNRLGYPRLAARLRLSGSNIVEFIFYPDGSIDNLKLTLNAEYEVFDKRTLELIQIAYKDYPRPKEATKIKFIVNYKSY